MQSQNRLKLSRRVLARAAPWLICLGSLALVTGQNCARSGPGSSSTEGLPNPIVQQNNGGLYGGLTFQNGGSYGQGELEPPLPPVYDPRISTTIYDAFVLARRGVNCIAASATPKSYGAVSGLIAGILAATQPIPYLRTSVCAAPEPLMKSLLRVLDFDTSVGLYRSGIYFHYDKVPKTESALKFPIAYCRRIQTVNGVDFGLSVVTYILNGKLNAVISQGKNVDGQAFKFQVPAFEVIQEISPNFVTISQSGFHLEIARTGTRATTGLLTATIDSTLISQNLSCWLEVP